MKKLKYLTVYLLPLTVAVSFTNQGLLSFLPVLIFFVLIPIIEHYLPQDYSNLSGKEKEIAENDRFYDLLLYSMLPTQVGFLIWYLVIIPDSVSNLETIGRTVSMGLMCGIIGINVGHELGHRTNRWEQFLGEILLTTSLENHFLPYHNRGHHTNVATPDDPATARRNEPLYFFWIRSHFGSYFQAWKIEKDRMKIMGLSFLHWKNKMLIYSLVQIVICGIVFILFQLSGLLFFLSVATIGILLLETVNYIEHYGLLRKKRDNGTYDRVRRIHSWNSNHILGRVVLFELSRHSDHHFKPDRPYQLLESRDESPVMPSGYPGMMLLSFIPPLFFKVMNKRIIEDK